MKIRQFKPIFLLILYITIVALPIQGCGYKNTIDNGTGTSPESVTETESKKLVKAPFYDEVQGLPNIEAPEDFDWKQFKGTTLNFLVENNIYANVLTKESEQFTKITGINVNIRPMDFDTLIDKINLDFISKIGKYQIIYADPYQTLNRFSNNFEDLNKYNNDPALPHIPGGMEDFFKRQVEVDSFFLNRDKLLTIPFDSTTMILYYRKDIFDKYRDQFKSEKGYDWTPGTKEFTWERYSEVAQWITDNVPKNEVKYGSGHMAKRHDSLYCDFSNVLAAYGGNYFKDKDVGGLGVQTPEQLNVDDTFIKALQMYKKIIKAAAPESISWEWTKTADAFRAGEIAMMPNWDENESSMENVETSKVAGKVGYSILPYGAVRSANIFGGSGIGINKDSSEAEKKAAWLFIVWSTSPQTELLVLKHPQGGVVPSRASVYEDRDVKTALNNYNGDLMKLMKLFHLPAVLNTWKDEHAYYRPKIGNFYEVEAVIINQIHRMLREDLSEKDTAENIAKQIQDLIYKSR